MKKKSTSKSAFFNLRILLAAALCLVGIAVALFGMGAFSNVFAQEKAAKTNQNVPGSQMPDVVTMIGPVVLDRDLRTMPHVAPAKKGKDFEDKGPLSRYPYLDNYQVRTPSGYEAATAGLPNIQKLLKNIWSPVPNIPPPLLTFDGLFGDPDNPVPDNDGDVGPNHYIESIKRPRLCRWSRYAYCCIGGGPALDYRRRALP